MRYSIALTAAREAVRPTPLADVLDSLRRAGAIESYRVEGDDLVVLADAALEVAALFSEAGEVARVSGAFRTPPAPPANRSRGEAVDDDSDGAYRGPTLDQRMGFAHSRDAGRTYMDSSRDYYSQARAFTHTRAFRALPKGRREIWRLHARGLTQREIALLVGRLQKAVARAVLAIRPLAGLQRTSRTIPRGPSSSGQSEE